MRALSFAPRVLGLGWRCTFGIALLVSLASKPMFAVGQQESDNPDVLPPTRITDQEEPTADLPTLPETVVTGDRDEGVFTPSDFPTQPLSSDELVTPSRVTSNAARNASSITVISREELRQRGQQTVGEALRGVVGLDVVRSGGPGGQTSLFMRGAKSEHTKVLVDGISVNDPSAPTRAFDFGNLLVDNIERIEVLRGPQSMVYGSDAIGGVINIVTARGQGPLSLRARSEGGSFGTAQQGLNVSGGDDLIYYSLSGSFLHSDGVSAADSRLGNTERDGYQNVTASGRFGWTPSDAINIDYVFRFIDADREIDSVLPPNFVFTDDLLRRNLATTFFQRIQLQSFLMDGLIEQKVGFNFTDYDRSDTHPQFQDPRFMGQAKQFDYVANLTLLENNWLTAGLDYLDEQASSTSVTQRTQNNVGLWVQDAWSLAEIWTATAGVRFDDHSAAGRAQTYRFTNLVQVPDTNLQFHGTIGTGFRAPALAQNFFPGGNPGLRPERSKGWDIGATHTFSDGRFTLDATYYRNDFTDLIDFDPITFIQRNIASARASGVEVIGTWMMSPRTTVSANYTLTDTRDLQFQEELPRRPQQKASLTVSRTWLDNRARGNLYVFYVGERLDFASRFGGTVLDDYVLVNLTGNYQLNRHWELFARLDNALNQHYQEAGGFGAPGIAGYGGMNLVW
ncbi:MAG: TonB-dependent receptor [Planctomycetales bacterium]|nr:TonB-dependent receptor [Planctomycetales bacterium]